MTRVELRVVVRGREGLHARPAARVVEAARKFSSEVTLVHGNVRASAKDLMDLLYLAAPGGSELRLEAEGPDAEEAARALEALFAAMGEEG